MAEDSTPITNSDGVFDIKPPQKQAADPTSRPGVSQPSPQPDPMLNPTPPNDIADAPADSSSVNETSDSNIEVSDVPTDANTIEPVDMSSVDSSMPSEESPSTTPDNISDANVNNDASSDVTDSANIETNPPSVTGNFSENTPEMDNQASSEISSGESIPVTNLSSPLTPTSPPMEKPSDQTLASLGLTPSSGDGLGDDSAPDSASSVPSPVVTNPMVNNDSGHNPADAVRPKSNKLLILILSVLIVLAIVLLIFIFLTKK